MEVIEYSSFNPAVNIALEEVLLEAVRRGYRGPLARIWVNPQSVVIGYSLKPCEELYCEEVLRLGIPVLRRVSGGGAVYHDLGNINITIVKPSNSLKQLEEVYGEITGFILRVLRKLGVIGWVENLNDVVVGGFKVSGSSAALRYGGYLVHGTLLVTANMEVLKRVVKPRIERVVKGGVTPAKYNPANLRDIAGVSFGEVLRSLRETLEEVHGPLERSNIADNELNEAVEIARSRVLVSHLQQL